MNRRDFLMLVGASIGTLTGPAAYAGTPSEALLATVKQRDPTALWVRRNGETFLIDIGSPEGFRSAAWALRDVQAGVVGVPSYNLLRLLAWGQAWLASYGRHEPYEILSGLRMPSTNRKTEGAAMNSDHLPRNGRVFHAADVKYRGVPADYLARLFFQAKFGGVGYYSRGFVHVSDNPRRVALWKRK